MNLSRSGQSTSLFFIILPAGLALLHLWSLLRFPAPYVDEAWLISRGLAFLQTGHPFGPLDGGVAERFPGYWVANQWLFTWLQSLFLRLHPTVDLLLARSESLVFGAILLAASFGIAYRLGGLKLAALSSVLLALSREFFFSAHTVRYDIYAAAFAYVATWLYLLHRPRRAWLCFFSGLLIGLALDIHLNALIFAPAVLSLIIVDYGRSFYRRAAFWWFALGGLAGALFYVSIHILPYPETYRALSQIIIGQSHTPLLLKLNPGNLFSSVDQTFRLIRVAVPTYYLLLPFPIYQILKQGSKEGRKLLVFSTVLLLGTILLLPLKSGQYGILIAPALIWLIATFFLKVFSRPWRHQIWDYASRSIVIGSLIATGVSLISEVLAVDQYAGYQIAQAQVNAGIRPTESIMGAQVYWLGLSDHPYRSWETLYIYQRLTPGSSLEDAFSAFRPDVFILDQPTWDYIETDEVNGGLALGDARPYTSLVDYLDAYATSDDIINSTTYGKIHLYRFPWSTDAEK